MGGYFPKYIIVTCVMASLLFNFVEESVFATDAEINISAVFSEMKDKDANIRKKAALRVLDIDLNKKLADNRDEAIVHLKILLTDPEKAVRYQAADVLARMDPSCKECIPILIEALKEGDIDAQYYIEALGRFGQDAGDAVPAIIEAMKTKSDNGSWEFWCTNALEQIGTPEALKAIKPFKQLLVSRQRLVRPIAIMSGNRIGSSLVIFGLLGLFWWSRIQRKKGLKLIGWPLFIPIPVWGMCVYDPVQYLPLFDFTIQIGLLAVTLVGIIPLLASLLWWKNHRMSDAPTS